MKPKRLFERAGYADFRTAIWEAGWIRFDQATNPPEIAVQGRIEAVAAWIRSRPAPEPCVHQGCAAITLRKTTGTPLAATVVRAEDAPTALRFFTLILDPQCQAEAIRLLASVGITRVQEGD